jgi:hypothetical protein
MLPSRKHRHRWSSPKVVEAPVVEPEKTGNDYWLPAGDNVAHVSEFDQLGYRITQLFNFAVRTYTQISTNLKTGSESQSIRTFDEFEGYDDHRTGDYRSA